MSNLSWTETIHQVPQELQDLNQWVVWRYDTNDRGDIVKMPYSPYGHKASSTRPSDWGPFKTCISLAIDWDFDGIGFMLSANDPYCLIDLDDKPHRPATEEQRARHKRIMQAFQSYTELSVSGAGFHILVKGSVETGRNKDNVEVYSSERFVIMTGNVVKNLPIEDYSNYINLLYNEMEPEESNRVELAQVDGPLTDDQVIEMAMSAENGEKFTDLCRGIWQEMGFHSQSEADFALLSMLAFYTRDNRQVRRIFRLTELGKRDKAHKNDIYLNIALSKIRAKEAPMIDMGVLMASFKYTDPAVKYPEPKESKPVVASKPLIEPEHTLEKPDLLLPPGLIGEIANYIYMTSYRPVKEYSMMASLAMIAGITGRAYQISNTGLNQYFVVLGGTGTGKEAMASAIDNLFAHTRPKVPMIDTFNGPGVFASGQGFNKTLQEKQCFVSILSEFAHMLASMMQRNKASDHQLALKANLLKAYSASGPNQIYKGTAYSDREKNIEPIRAPNATILGECTPEYFFSILSEDHAADGFIPRLLVQQYTGGRPPLNDGAGAPPSPELVQKIADLATASITVQQQNQCVPIQQTGDAAKLLRDYSDEIDAKMNSLPETPVKQILNRSHIKALKLSGLLAVGINPYNPVVTIELAHWAIEFVRQGDRLMTGKFDSGEVGEGDIMFEAVIRRAVDAYRMATVDIRIKTYKCPVAVAHMPVVPFAAIRDYSKRREPFKSHRLGYSKALDIALEDLIKAGILVDVPNIQIPAGTNGIRPKCFGIGDNF